MKSCQEIYRVNQISVIFMVSELISLIDWDHGPDQTSSHCALLQRPSFPIQRIQSFVSTISSKISISCKPQCSQFRISETRIFQLAPVGNTRYYLWLKVKIYSVSSQDTPPPEGEIDDVNNQDLAAWSSTYRLVKAWITVTISEEALGTVVGLTTSFDV